MVNRYRGWSRDGKICGVVVMQIKRLISQPRDGKCASRARIQKRKLNVPQKSLIRCPSRHKGSRFQIPQSEQRDRL